MPLRDLLKKKEKPESQSPAAAAVAEEPLPSPPPQFTFMRSDTHTQEVISLPDDPPDELYDAAPAATDGSGDAAAAGSSHRGRFSRLTGGRSRSRSTSTASNASEAPKAPKDQQQQQRPSNTKRLSQKLGLRKEDSSVAVPRDLPEIQDGFGGGGEGEGGDGGSGDGDVEDRWEQRATILAKENERSRSRGGSRPGTPVVKVKEDGDGDGPDVAGLRLVEGKEGAGGIVASKSTDDNIQEAIRLHEAGELTEATKMFGRLADPNGENNALSQVLYALALRHGWGCPADPPKAMEYLSAAAANAASIETEALQAGRKGGGAAKGELVLAIFELANSFRHGWGVKKDPIAAKQYYETAANLGDTDAMNEVGWCYLEGFGCKKDKLKSAKYYRLAESGGNKILGNSWIWKPKYDPPKA